jgi:hypothetical protein
MKRIIRQTPLTEEEVKADDEIRRQIEEEFPPLNKHVHVFGDGITVWINDAVSCLGRFGRGGIDIHHRFDPDAKYGTECLYCTHTPPTLADWETFKEKMLELHGITVDDEVMPTRFIEERNASLPRTVVRKQ